MNITPPRSLGFCNMFAPSDDYGMHIPYGSIDSIHLYRFYHCPDHDRFVFFAEPSAATYLLVYEKDKNLFCYCEKHSYDRGNVLKDKENPPSMEEMIIRSKNYLNSCHIKLSDIHSHLDARSLDSKISDFYEKVLLAYHLNNSLAAKNPEKTRKI